VDALLEREGVVGEWRKFLAARTTPGRRAAQEILDHSTS